MNTIKELKAKEKYDNMLKRKNKETEKLKEMKLHTEKYASEMEDKYILEKNKNNKAIEFIENNTYKSNATEYMDLTGISELLDILKGVDKKVKELSPYYESVDNGYRQLSYEEVVEGLQQEIERLNKENTILRQNSQYLVKQKDELEELINKAIEYIENYLCSDEYIQSDINSIANAFVKLVDILKGVDKE